MNPTKNILRFRANSPKILLQVRTAIEGPEQKLVQQFLQKIRQDFKSKHTHLAIFEEPSLEIGFPDIVIAEYKPRVFDNWQSHRFYLQKNDIKVLHFLFSSCGATTEEIIKKLGLSKSKLLRIIESLLDAKLIRRYSGEWRTLRLENIFGIKNLNAVEVKIQNTASVMYQAYLNKWFASRSHILTPYSFHTTATLNIAKEYGIGIYTFKDNTISETLSSEVLAVPSSYASWYLNEWIGRKINSANH